MTETTHLYLELQNKKQALTCEINKLKRKIKQKKITNIYLACQNNIIKFNENVKKIDNDTILLNNTMNTITQIRQELISIKPRIEKIYKIKKIYQNKLLLYIDNKLYLQIAKYNNISTESNRIDISFIRNFIGKQLLSMTDEYIVNNIANNFINNQISITINDIETITRIKHICANYKMRPVNVPYRKYYKIKHHQFKITHNKLINFILNQYLFNTDSNKFNFS